MSALRKPTYRLLRTAQTAQGGLEKFNITISCEMAALNWLSHCFLESSQGHVKMLGILNKKLDFWVIFVPLFLLTKNIRI